MPDREHQTKQIIESAVRIGAIAGIAWICFAIFRPFILPLAWGLIIAVAVNPLFVRLCSALGGRRRLAAAIFAVLGLALLIVPTVMLGISAAEGLQSARHAYEAGTLRVPPPDESVADWPIVGERVYDTWVAASANLTATLERYGHQLLRLGSGLLGAAAGVGATIVQFIIAILIATALLANADAGANFARTIVRRIAGESAVAFNDLAVATTRSVAQGVLGVALIQAVLAGLGMLAVGVPAAGLWAVAVLILAVLQLPTFLALLPVVVWVFSSSATLPAVLFAIWASVVGVSDTFLKPALLGRGLDIPMLIILLGAIGGMMAAGVIGLFVGAVVLALAYKIFMAWLEEEATPGPHP